MDNYQLGHDILPFLEALESYDRNDLAFNSMVKGLRSYERKEKRKAERMAHQPQQAEKATNFLKGFGTFLLIVSWLAFVAGIVFIFVLPVYFEYEPSPRLSLGDLYSIHFLLNNHYTNWAIFITSATIFSLCFSARIRNPKKSAGTNIVSGIWSIIACIFLTLVYSYSTTFLKFEYIFSLNIKYPSELVAFYECCKFFILTSMSFILCNVYGSKFGIFIHNLFTEDSFYRKEGIKKPGKGEKTFIVFLIIGILLAFSFNGTIYTRIFRDSDSTSILRYLLCIQIITLAIVFRANSRRFGVIAENLYCAFVVINFTSICIYFIICSSNERYLLGSFVCALVIALLVLVHLPARKTHIAGLSNWLIVFLAFSAFTARYIMNQSSISYNSMMDKTLMVPSILISAIALKNVLLRLTKFR